MSDPKGGLGGNLGPGRGIRDTRLVERALRERWPIPKAIRRPLIERLYEIVEDTESSPREVTSAAKAILSASKINLDSVTAIIKAQEHQELIARVAQLEKDAETPRPRIQIPRVDDRYPTPPNGERDAEAE